MGRQLHQMNYKIQHLGHQLLSPQWWWRWNWSLKCWIYNSSHVAVFPRKLNRFLSPWKLQDINSAESHCKLHMCHDVASCCVKYSWDVTSFPAACLHGLTLRCLSVPVICFGNSLCVECFMTWEFLHHCVLAIHGTNGELFKILMQRHIKWGKIWYVMKFLFFLCRYFF